METTHIYYVKYTHNVSFKMFKYSIIIHAFLNILIVRVYSYIRKLDVSLIPV